jgi:hypothetical protein
MSRRDGMGPNPNSRGPRDGRGNGMGRGLGRGLGRRLQNDNIDSPIISNDMDIENQGGGKKGLCK